MVHYPNEYWTRTESIVDLSIIPIAAITSLLTTVVVRWVDKPKPKIVGENLFSSESQDYQDAMEKTFPEETHSDFKITNVGNGDLYDVRFYGSLCDVAFFSPKEHQRGWTYDYIKPVLKAGESVTLKVSFNKIDVDKAEIIVSHPLFSRLSYPRQADSFRIETSPLETTWDVGMLGYEKVPRHFRGWRDLTNYSPRAAIHSHHHRLAESDDESELQSP